ncbi:MAG: hypothetical protein WDM76_14335 [Limisphaerales bacterium]
MAPDQPEARYDLARLKPFSEKTSESLEILKVALDMSAQRLRHDSKARDLIAEARKDRPIDAIRNLPEFKSSSRPISLVIHPGCEFRQMS